MRAKAPRRSVGQGAGVAGRGRVWGSGQGRHVAGVTVLSLVFVESVEWTNPEVHTAKLQVPGSPYEEEFVFSIAKCFSSTSKRDLVVSRCSGHLDCGFPECSPCETFVSNTQGHMWCLGHRRRSGMLSEWIKEWWWTEKPGTAAENGNRIKYKNRYRFFQIWFQPLINTLHRIRYILYSNSHLIFFFWCCNFLHFTY